MSTTERAPSAIFDLEPVLAKLEHDSRLIGHLATSEAEVEVDEWLNVENALLAGHKELKRLWRLAFDQHGADKGVHEAELAAAEARNEPLGQKQLEYFEGLRTMVRAACEIAIQRLDGKPAAAKLTPG
jgi:hypothetical protein